MATPIQATKTVHYTYDSNAQPYDNYKQAEDFQLPYTFSVTPGNIFEDTKAATVYLAFPIPAEYRYKRANIIIRVNYTTNTAHTARNTFVFTEFYKSGQFNFQSPVVKNYISGGVTPAHFAALGWHDAPAIFDENYQTQMSHMASPWAYTASSTSGTLTFTNSVDDYIGPSNYFAVGLYIKPAQYDYPTSEGVKIAYAPCAVTINSAEIEINENVEPINYNIFNPIYPDNVNVKQTNDTVFSWSMGVIFPTNMDKYYVMPLSGRSIKYKKDTETQTTEIYEEGDAYNVEAEANTFDVGKYKYQIVLYDIYDNHISSEFIDFGVIGQDAAPSITNITDDSIPTITWEDTNQAGYELVLKDSSQKIIYESGIVIGTNLSQKIPQMLENGSYIVEIREINTFGILSEWGSAEFTLNLEEVDAPSDIIAVVNKDFGVEISGSPAENAVKTFVVRKKARSEEIEVIGEYTGGIFTDYQVEGNTFYEYSLRNYDAAFADGAFIPVQVKVKEVVLHDAEDFKKYIELHLSEDNSFDIGWTESQSKTLYRTLGRPYPVKEIGEWKDTTRTFKAFVKEEDWNKVLDMYYNTQKIYFKADHEFFACDMEMTDKGRYISGGYIIEFSVTRISEDKEAII